MQFSFRGEIGKVLLECLACYISSVWNVTWFWRLHTKRDPWKREWVIFSVLFYTQNKTPMKSQSRRQPFFPSLSNNIVWWKLTWEAVTRHEIRGESRRASHRFFTSFSVCLCSCLFLWPRFVNSPVMKWMILVTSHCNLKCLPTSCVSKQCLVLCLPSCSWKLKPLKMHMPIVSCFSSSWSVSLHLLSSITENVRGKMIRERMSGSGRVTKKTTIIFTVLL